MCSTVGYLCSCLDRVNFRDLHLHDSSIAKYEYYLLKLG
jgi:hypothetical protein